MAARLGDLAREDLVGNQLLPSMSGEIVLQAVGELERRLRPERRVPASSEGAHFQRISTPPNR